MLKKILSVFLTVSLVCSTFCTISHGDGSFLYVGDSSPEVVFSGSVSGHYLLLSGSGIVSAFGNNEYGQCGVTAGEKIDKVNYIDFENKVKKVSAGDCFSLALDEKGMAWGWGSNAENQLGISDSKENVFEKPQKIAENISDIAAGKKLPMLACNEYLAKVGLCSANYLTREVDKSLSGGEVKRIEIATILARDPKLAIYDEPEAGIDLWSFDRLTETFRDIHAARDGRSIVIISHQERIIQLADEIVLLRAGKVSETGTPEELLPKLGFVAKGTPQCQLSQPTELHLTEIPTTC